MMRTRAGDTCGHEQVTCVDMHSGLPMVVPPMLVLPSAKTALPLGLVLVPATNICDMGQETLCKSL